jgi:hypothetical protein
MGLTTSLPIAALEFGQHGNNSRTLNAVLATGVIEWDDVEKLDQFLTRQPKKRHTAIYFDRR